MKTLSADDWDDRNDLRLSQKPSTLLIRIKFGLDAAEVEKKIKQKCSHRVGAILGRYLNKKKSFPSSFRGDVTMSSSNSSTPREKRMVRHEVCSTLKIHHYIRLVCQTRAKIPSSDPETSLTTGRFLFWGRSRRLYGNDKSSQSS